jgi:hypothetical protein
MRWKVRGGNQRVGAVIIISRVLSFSSSKAVVVMQLFSHCPAGIAV